MISVAKVLILLGHFVHVNGKVDNLRGNDVTPQIKERVLSGLTSDDLEIVVNGGTSAVCEYPSDTCCDHENAIIYDDASFFSSDWTDACPSLDPSWTLDLQARYPISKVLVRNDLRYAESKERTKYATVQILNEADEVESEELLQNVMTNGNEEDIIIQFSPPVFGQKVRVILKRQHITEKTGLSFNYVRVYQSGSMRCSKFSGDVHLVTFDGVAYDCQGTGEFILATSPEFKLHAQFEQVNSRPSVSTTRALAIEVPNVPKVVVRAGSWSGGCTMTVSVGGNADVTLPHVESGLQISGEKVSTSGSMVGVEINYTGVKYHRVNVFMSGSSYWDCMLHVDTCVHGVATKGLLGTPDDDPTNDWPKKDSGEFEVIPAYTYDRLFEKAFDWCTDNWCVTKSAESLFGSLLPCAVGYNDATENLFKSEADLGTIMARCNDIVGRGKGNVQGGVNQCLIDFIMFKDIAQPNDVPGFFTAFADEQRVFEEHLPDRPPEEKKTCVVRELTEVTCETPKTTTT